MNELREPNTDMIGVYGIGGVGKTTLAKEIYRQALEDKTLLFDDVVILLDVKGIAGDLKEIQKRIAEKLGMDILGDESIDKRAGCLFGRMKNKKVLVILDDLQEKVDLEIVGLPRVWNCKVLLTSRTREVLSVEMRTQKEFPLDLLDENENWSLFETMAGGVVKDPTIREVATQVAKKCGGLPLLVVTVASAMKNKITLEAWRDALRRLKTFEEKGFMEKAFLALEWSYEQLDDEELKALFLLCGIVSESGISLPDLFKYSMGLGLLKNVETMKEAHDSLHSLVEKLKDSCLLLEGDDESVRMHDLVHEVVMRIASRDQHVFKVATGAEFKEWPTKDFCIKSTMIILDNCTITHLPEGLEFPELKMFLFHSRNVDHHLEIPSNFLEGMKKLRVLDLTALSIPSLPPALPFLKSLQALHLDQCTLGDLALVGELKNLEILSLSHSMFTKLPKEIGQLTRLRLLDLNDCRQLKVISPNVISKLKRLEILRMGNSFNQWEGEGVVSSERRNANIEELKHLTLLTSLQIHIVDANILPADLFTTSKLERFQICIGSAWKWNTVDESLNALKLQLTASNELDQGLGILLKGTENLYLEGTEDVNNSIVHHLGAEGFQKLQHLHVKTNVEFMNIINPKARYPNLTWLEVSEINGLRFLLSSSMARSLAQLKHLQISGCQKMEEIVSIEKSDVEIVGNFFCQLQQLELKDLPNLTKFLSRSFTELSNLSPGRLQSEDFIKRNTVCEEIEESDSTGNAGIVIQHFLFDKKVEFPNLKKLSIHGLAKLTTIWNDQFCLESSKNLETIEIDSCDNLNSIFPASMARNLHQLRSLIICNSGVKEIVSKDDVLKTPTFVFLNLAYLIFENLPQLRSFYPGVHSSKWPSLVGLGMYGCSNEVRIFAEGSRELNNLCTPNKQSLFLLEKDTFPNLEHLGFHMMGNWENPPIHLFRKLKTLTTYAHDNSSMDSLEKLLGFEKVNREIHADGDRTLPFLKELHIYGMRKLMNLEEDSFGPACPYFPKVENLTLEDCDSLRNLRSSAISFRNLKSLRVSRCKGLIYLISYSMANSLMHLTKLEVEACEEMIEIVGINENDDSENDIEFKVLKHLELYALPCLRGFCAGTRSRIVKFPSLETLSISSCSQLEAFIFDPNCTIGKDIKGTNSIENIETGVVQQFLFDKKVEFPSLRSLSIKRLTKLTAIWHSQLSLHSFSRLEDLEVYGCGNLTSIFVPSIIGRLNALATLFIMWCKSLRVVFEVGGIDVQEIHDTSAELESLNSVNIYSCENLKNIFPTSVARNLRQLTRLEVCSSGVEEIIGRDEELQTPPKFVFPKVTCVSFKKLSQLKNFYPGMHISSWPSLIQLNVNECFRVNILAKDISSFQGDDESEHLDSRALFLIEKDSFPNLEELHLEGTEIWNGPLPVQLFSKLKYLELAALQSMPAVFLEGNNSSINAVGIVTEQQQQWHLPHLKMLRLVRNEKLMHLGKEDEDNNTQSAPRIPNIPNLEILILNGGGSLRNLRSSAISFNNLTTLQVTNCDGLIYLITYSMANSLMQLTTLKIKACLRLVEIMASDEDDNSRHEITFRRLKHLNLLRLPRLQRFCSGNCIPKFPFLEISTMSKRLKLKIFTAHDQILQLTNEGEDTDVERAEERMKRESASTD